MRTLPKTFKTRLFDSCFLRGVSDETVSNRTLCIVFHGKGDSLDAFQDIPREIGILKFDFLLLNAPLPYEDGFRWILDEPHHEKSLVVLRDQLFQLIEELKEFGFLTKNIILLGHSQGGRVATDFVMNSPDQFRAVVAVSSYVGFFRGWDLPEAKDETGAWKTPWLFTHGIYDRIICPKEIRRDVQKLTRQKIPLTYKEFHKGHDFDFRHEMPFIRHWLERQAVV